MQTVTLVHQVLVKRVLLKSVCEAVVFIYLVNRFVSCEETKMIPESVSRRLSGDAVYFKSDDMICSVEDNFTYIVEERECMSNEKLLSGNV